MKIFTRFLGVLLLLLVQLSALAATITVEVGDNFYRPQIVNIRPGDVVRWVNIGSSAHPTASDSNPQAWATFVISPSSTSFTSQPFNTIGNFYYHCEAHGIAGNGTSLGLGQAGAIFVSSSPQATLDSKASMTGLNLYPNPSKGMVTLTVNQKAPGEYKLRLSNIIGREVRTFTLRPEAASGMPLNLSDLPAGMYVYSLLLNDKVVATKRLILQN